MWPNQQESADLVTFTEEILNGQLHFLCSVLHVMTKSKIWRILLFSFFLQRRFQDPAKDGNLFPKIVNNFNSINTFARSSVPDVWQGPVCVYVVVTEFLLGKSSEVPREV